MLQTALDATSVKACPPAWLPCAAGHTECQLLNHPGVQEEERLFTQLIDKYRPSVGKTDTPWAADVVGRAIGNRGNARSRQGDFNAAIRDYNEAMVLCPWSVDPMLNRSSHRPVHAWPCTKLWSMQPRQEPSAAVAESAKQVLMLVVVSAMCRAADATAVAAYAGCAANAGTRAACPQISTAMPTSGL